MIAYSELLLPGVFVVLGLVLVGLSTRSRFTAKPLPGFAVTDEETNNRWRFGFFVGWTLLLPLAWLLEWYVWYGFWKAWQTMPNPLAEFTYGRKVISDLWTAVAAVLGLLAWNKKP